LITDRAASALFPQLRRFQRVFHQHGHGHRAHAARHRGDEGGAFTRLLEADIAAQLAIRQPVDADVDDDGSDFI